MEADYWSVFTSTARQEVLKRTSFHHYCLARSPQENQFSPTLFSTTSSRKPVFTSTVWQEVLKRTRFHQYCLARSPQENQFSPVLFGKKSSREPVFTSTVWQEVLKRTSLPSLESVLFQVQLHWAGYHIDGRCIHASSSLRQ